MHTVRTLLASTVLALGALSTTQPAHAVLLSYTFNATAASGSFLDLGGGAVDLSDVGYTATGVTLSDVDSDPDPTIGRYAARTTYDFGGLGSFTTDASTGEFYTQNCETALDFSCILLSGGPGVFGSSIATFNGSLISEDPNAGGVALGVYLGEGGGFDRTITNLSGHTLFVRSAVTPTRAFVTAVTEPTTLLLSGLLLAGMAVGRRRV